MKEPYTLYHSYYCVMIIAVQCKSCAYSLYTVSMDDLKTNVSVYN